MESYFSQTFRLKEKHEKKLYQRQHEKKYFDYFESNIGL